MTRELQTELEPELLRGVPLDVCLQAWGKHFVPPDPGMFQVDHENYELSHVTKEYEEFLSHDWQTSRLQKLIAMLIIYNSRAAFISSLLVSVSVGILTACDLLPQQLWIQFCDPTARKERLYNALLCLALRQLQRLPCGAMLLAADSTAGAIPAKDSFPGQALYRTARRGLEAERHLRPCWISGSFASAHHSVVQEVLSQAPLPLRLYAYIIKTYII